MRYLAAVLLLASWLAGVVLASGFWLTTLAIFMPFYAWYLVVERVMKVTGLL